MGSSDEASTWNETDAHYHFLLEFCHTHPGSHEGKPPHWRQEHVLEIVPGRPRPLADIPKPLQGFLDSRARFGIKQGLDNMRALLSALDITRTPAVLLVGGTNGKGTVATAIADAFSASGHRPGLYLSPHVERFLERIQVMAGDPDDRVVAAAGDRVTAAVRRLDADGIHPTYFETATALALEVFRATRAAPLVLEVGMGGRWDAVNALTPAASIITNIGTDHLDVLGRSVAERAREKAGILRPGVPAFTAAQGEALDHLQAEARRIGAPLVATLPRDAAASPATAARSLVRAVLSDPRIVARFPRLAEWEPGSLVLPRLPARQEPWRVGTGNDEKRVLLDGAHNEEALAHLTAALEQEPVPHEARTLLVGLLRDKALAPLARLATRFPRVVATRAPGERAAGSEELAAGLHEHNVAAERVQTVEDPERALAIALKATPPGGLLVIAGSFYLAGVVRPILRRVGRRA